MCSGEGSSGGIQMSQLFFTETGRVLSHANEEISRWRWAKKLLRIPRAFSDGELWLYVRPYPRSPLPLRIEINRKYAASLRPQANRAESSWQWSRVAIKKGILRSGVNEIVLSCSSDAMNAWMLGIENGHDDPQSYLSTDRGRSWQNRRM